MHPARIIRTAGMRPAGFSNQPTFESHIQKYGVGHSEAAKRFRARPGGFLAMRNRFGNIPPRRPGNPRAAGGIFDRMPLFRSRPAPALLRVFPG